MNLRLLTFLAVLLCQLMPRTVGADEILLIINQTATPKKLTIKQIRNIFLKKDRLNNSGLRWIPVNLNPDHPIRVAFSKMLFNQQPEDMEQYWNAQYFNGISPPYVVASEEAMQIFVSTTPGAIGYISPCNIDSHVHVIFKLVISGTSNQACKKP